MPLLDHLRPPISKRSSWEGFHGGWPMRIVEDLAPSLPDGFVAEPRVHLGSYYEIDVSALEQDAQRIALDSAALAGGGAATSMKASAEPTLTIDAEFPEQYAYEVLIYDLQPDLANPGSLRGRRWHCK
jgi:hypothetical protein